MNTDRPTDAPPPSDTRPGEPREAADLLKGLTSNLDATPGLSVLSDALEELEALGGLLSTAGDVLPHELAVLLRGIARRLGAADALLRREHELGRKEQP